jgi:RND family efflux transporter MFP subunit
MMQKILDYKKWLGVGALLLIIILYFIFSGRGRSTQQSQEFYSVTTGDVVRQIQLSGTVQPLFSEDVASMVNARIKKVLFKDGDLVSKGQLLIQFNEDDLTTKLETERAKYLNAKNKLREIEVWQSSTQFVNAKTGLENAETDFHDKEKLHLQNEELYQLKAISKNDLDRSKIELDRARSTLEGTKAAFEDAKMKGSKDALQEVRSNAIAAEITFQDAKRALPYKEIAAPYTGVVTMKQQSASPLGGVEKSVSENRSVAPGEILLTISDRDRFTADLQVDEYDIFKIHLDQACQIIIPALPKESFAGKIISISSDKSGKGASFQVRCQIDNPSSLLKVGMTANVLIPLEEKKGVLVVPLSSLIKMGGVDGVFLAGKEEPKFHPVQVGLSNNDLAEITQGLTAGQQILRKIPGQLSEGG